MDSMQTQPHQIQLNPSEQPSYFDGRTWQLAGRTVLAWFVTCISLGLAFPWMLCMLQEWQAKHTVVNGRRMRFTGTGGQLIGKFILWWFLSLITFGVYTVWLGLGVKKWVVKHTVFEDEVTTPSYFSGGAGGYFVAHAFSWLLILFTLGLAKPWADRMVITWETNHTHIGGETLTFVGKGGGLFWHYLLLYILTPLTLGIYALLFPVRYIRWKVENTKVVSKITPAAKQNYGVVWVLVILLLAAGLGIFGLIGYNTISYNDMVQKQNDFGQLIRLSQVKIMQPLNPDQVEGTTYDTLGKEGDFYQYILDENLFYDKDSKVLYLRFGVLNEGKGIYFTCNETSQWQTATVGGSGILQIPYQHETVPTSINVMESQTGHLLGEYPVTVSVGDVNDANAWLDGVYYQEPQETPEENNGEQVQEEQQPSLSFTAADLVGQWVYGTKYPLAPEGTGMDLKRIYFYADGTCSIGIDYCSQTTAVTKDYLYGSYWQVNSGNSYSGTYTLNGNQLTTTVNVAEEGETIVSTTVYTVIYEGDTLTMAYQFNGVDVTETLIRHS